MRPALETTISHPHISSPCIALCNWVEHLEPHHLQPTTNGPRCARLDLRDIKRFEPLDNRSNHHIPDHMLEEDILCRLSGAILTTTPPLTRSSARYTISATLAEKFEGESEASKMKYGL